MSRLIISENDRKHIKSLYNILNEDAKSIAKNIYDASSGVGTDEDKFLKAVLEIDTLETFKEVDRILKTFDYGGGFYDYVEGELGMLDEELINKIKNHVKNLKSKFLDGRYLTTSEQGKNDIKKHEGLKLNAYDLKDGHITIGYGHTGAMTSPKPKMGEVISKQTAEKYFENDIKKAEKIITDIMKSWKEQGLEYRITQNMFDAMVSIAFNTGRPTFRMCKFLQYLKQGKYKDAGNEVSFCATKRSKKDKDNNKERLKKGIQNRRDKEKAKFIKDL